MTTEHDNYFVFRNTDANYLFIFERDETLLHASQLASVSLGDISLDTIGVLRELRAHNIRFGFVSNQRGSDSDGHSVDQAAALIKILDHVLNADGVMPDFWMAWPRPVIHDKRSPPQAGAPSRLDEMIRQAMRWYSVDNAHCVFVGSLRESLAGAAELGIRAISLKRPPTRRTERVVPASVDGTVSDDQHVEGLIERWGKIHSPFGCRTRIE